MYVDAELEMLCRARNIKTSKDTFNRHLRGKLIGCAGAELVFRDLEKDEGLKVRFFRTERYKANEDRRNPATGSNCTDLSIELF